MGTRTNQRKRLIGWTAIAQHLSMTRQRLRRLVEVERNRVLIEVVRRDPITGRPCAFERDLNAILDDMETWI